MELMRDLHEKRVRDLIPDTLLVLEHEPVITKGRRLHGQDIPLHPELSRQKVIVRDADRGGLLTYHGPGQVVVYFIIKYGRFNLGVTDFVCLIEKAVIAFLSGLNVTAHTVPDHPGIWVAGRKTASIGLRLSCGVSSHGIAVNICNDACVYRYFSPCGLSGNIMTSLEEIWGRKIRREEFEDLSQRLADELIAHFQQPAKVSIPSLP